MDYENYLAKLKRDRMLERDIILKKMKEDKRQMELEIELQNKKSKKREFKKLYSKNRDISISHISLSKTNNVYPNFIYYRLPVFVNNKKTYLHKFISPSICKWLTGIYRKNSYKNMVELSKFVKMIRNKKMRHMTINFNHDEMVLAIDIEYKISKIKFSKTFNFRCSSLPKIYDSINMTFLEEIYYVFGKKCARQECKKIKKNLEKLNCENLDDVQKLSKYDLGKDIYKMLHKNQ